MKIIQNKWLPPRGYSAIMLLGFLFTRDQSKVSAETIRHESIHARQMWELLVVGFYLWYIIEWLVRLCKKGNAYRNISFEREAYANEHDATYLHRRKPFAFLQFLIS
ncbi:MAG: hypothetical protein LBU42_03310 [Prevotellaceae bacterium]|jgi:hypothetical protein|nr:hypothetical protein [Prevotellaceae bacterium]